MRIKKIELNNFKRFTSLTISDIPDTSKLVLVIGSNGSGKSSLFDAFDWLQKSFNNKIPRIGRAEETDDHYKKNSSINASVKVEFTDGRRVKNQL